jgi:Zn-finger nucleic acid-binding protein
MICPKCDSEMSEESRSGVKLDLCPVCYGVWFDGGELEAVHAAGEGVRLNGIPKRGGRYEPTGDSAHIRCPRCEGDILRHGKIARHKVLRCTSCRGLFLPDANSHYKTSETGILDAAVGALEEIVGALF